MIIWIILFVISIYALSYLNSLWDYWHKDADVFMLVIIWTFSVILAIEWWANIGTYWINKK